MKASQFIVQREETSLLREKNIVTKIKEQLLEKDCAQIFCGIS